MNPEVRPDLRLLELIVDESQERGDVTSPGRLLELPVEFWRCWNLEAWNCTEGKQPDHRDGAWTKEEPGA